MRKLLSIGVCMALLIPSLAAAQSAFNGTWAADLSQSRLPTQPEVYLLDGDSFRCTSCVPVIVVKANGTDQKVAGHTDFDTLSVKVLNGRETEAIAKKAGTVVATTRFVVATDGIVLSYLISESRAGVSSPVTMNIYATRVAKDPNGANELSGTWKITKVFPGKK
jgi:hypothetical protein